MHHVVDAATGYHVDFWLLVITIPQVLYVAGDGGIHLQEILELVEHQCKVVLLSVAKQLLEKLNKRF